MSQIIVSKYGSGIVTTDIKEAPISVSKIEQQTLKKPPCGGFSSQTENLD